MGLFWKSESDRIIEEIQDQVGSINRTLNLLQNSLITHNGASCDNIDELYNINENLQKQRLKLEGVVNRLASSKLPNVMVPWIDGRYFPIIMWMMSYNAAVGKLKYAIQQYAKTI